MTRYKALREIGVSRKEATLVAIINFIKRVPKGEIRINNVVIEMEK